MSSPVILKVKHHKAVPGHTMFGDWALPGRPNSYIALGDFAKACLHGKGPTRVTLTEICVKPGDWFGTNDFSGLRFEKADPRYPGILVRDMPNPCGLPYRMIDGRRRLEKIRRCGETSSLFYVFDFAEIAPYIFDFVVVRE
jgi:hypothetical protein